MADDDPAELKISSHEELRSFLVERWRQDAVAVAVRSAWRAMPLISRIGDDALLKRLALSAFRATLVAQRGRTDTPAHAATNAARDAAAAFATKGALHAASAAAAAVATKGALHDAEADLDDSGIFDGDGDVVNYSVYTVDAAATAIHNKSSSDQDKNLFWRNLQADCLALHAGKDLMRRPLWKSTPVWFDVEFADLRVRLREFGGGWPLIETWFRQIIANAAVDVFPNNVLDDIAEEHPDFWGDGDYNPDYDAIIAKIAERLDWSANEQNNKHLVSNNSIEGNSNRASFSQVLRDYPEEVTNLVEGLIMLVSAEREKIETTRPNSDAAKEEARRQVKFLDKLLAGLKEIQSSLKNESPEQSQEKVETVIRGLENWYETQPAWAQKAVKATGILTVATPFALVGFPAVVAAAVPSVFFAKSEIKEIKDLVTRAKEES